jgi:hypothetical protein
MTATVKVRIGKPTPEQTINGYREQLRRLYGDDVADKSELHYNRGWYYVNIARTFEDGSVGVLGAREAVRQKELLERTLRFKKREPEGTLYWR